MWSLWAIELSLTSACRIKLLREELKSDSSSSKKNTLRSLSSRIFEVVFLYTMSDSTARSEQFCKTHVTECEYNDDFGSFLLFFAFRSGCVPPITILSRGGYKHCIVRELVVKDILRGIKGVWGRTVNWVEVVLYVWYRRLNLGAQTSHTSQCDETSKGYTHTLSF